MWAYFEKQKLSGVLSKVRKQLEGYEIIKEYSCIDYISDVGGEITEHRIYATPKGIKSFIDKSLDFLVKWGSRSCILIGVIGILVNGLILQNKDATFEVMLLVGVLIMFISVIVSPFGFFIREISLHPLTDHVGMCCSKEFIDKFPEFKSKEVATDV